jgi:transcriptional regulator with XRE-family HTH domain
MLAMRHSSQKHNVARLRVKLNEFEKFEKLDQEQFAKLIGCSVWKLRNIELGRTELDELVARRISDETGVAREWLLENNPKAPPIAAFVIVSPNKSGRYTPASVKRAVSLRERGAPFTAETYRHTRLLRDLGVPVERKTLYRDLGGLYATVFYAWLRAIFATEDADVAVWKTGKFLEGLAAENGHDRNVLKMSHLKIAALRDHKLLWQQAEIGMRLAEHYAAEHYAAVKRPAVTKRTTGKKSRRSSRHR